MRWLAGPQLEIYVQAAECQPGFMENTSEWSSLMHCPWSTQFSGSAPLPFSRFFLFLGHAGSNALHTLKVKGTGIAGIFKDDKVDTITFCDPTFRPNVHRQSYL